MTPFFNFHIKRSYRFVGGLLSLLVTMLACSIDDTALEDVLAPGYGTSTANYSVKGKVSTKDSIPLKNILVEVPYSTNEAQPYQNTEKLYTNEKGEFEWKRGEYPKDQTFRFILKDIDGKENLGEFKNDTIDVKFTRKDLSDSGGDGIWNSGHAEKKIYIILTPKN